MPHLNLSPGKAAFNSVEKSPQLVTPQEGRFVFPDYFSSSSMLPEPPMVDDLHPQRRDSSNSYSQQSASFIKRHDSNASMVSLPNRYTSASALHTPASSQFNLQRYDSVSSICTLDDDDDCRPDTQYDWTSQQDELLRTMLDNYTSNPTNTPFAPGKPPSGVVQRVAKATLKRAASLGCYFPHNLSAIRKRILALSEWDSNDRQTDDQSRNFSWLETSGPNPVGQVLEESMPLSNKMNPTVTDYTMDRFSFEASDERPAQPSFSPIRSATERMRTTDRIQTMAPPETFGSNMLPLSSPFKESFDAAVPVEPRLQDPMSLAGRLASLKTDEEHNVMTKRKRDSLRLKRGMK